MPAEWLKPHHFQPGRSGNPRGTRSDKASVRHVLSQTQGGKELATICLAIARDKTRKSRDRLLAVQIMSDRCWGKPREQLTVESSSRLNVTELTQLVDALDAHEHEAGARTSVETTATEVEAAPRQIDFTTLDDAVDQLDAAGSTVGKGLKRTNKSHGCCSFPLEK